MLKRNKHIILALLLFVLCLGIKDKMVLAIDRCLIPIFGFSKNVWLSIFFICVSLLLLYVAVFVWLKKRKTLSEQDGSIVLFFVLLYAYFRFFDDHYVFSSFFGSHFCYLDPIAIIGALSLLYSFVKYVIRFVNKQSEEKTALRFYRDDAIKLPSEDIFGLEAWVDRLVARIAHTDVSNSSYSIGVVGKWGEGKSSLMNLVEQEIKAQDKLFVTVSFNPRNSKSINNIQEDFLNTLKHALKPYKTGLDSKISKYASSINAAEGTPGFVVWLMGLVNIQLRQNPESAKEAITNAIKSIGKRIVVFVDDFDRLTGEEIVEVLKMIDKNCSFPNMIYLTAYDKDNVNRLVTKSDAVIYSDKYFNTELPLPAHLPSHIFNYFAKLLNDAVDRKEIEVTNEEINNTLTYQWNLINRRIRTIRDVKRFVNLFLFYFVPMQKEVSFRDFMLLELIRFAHPNEYEKLHLLEYIHKGKTYAGSSGDDMWYLNDTLFPTQHGGKMVPPLLTPGCLDILQALFPTESNYSNWHERRYKRIYSASSYEYYFYSFEFNHLKSEDVEALLSTTSMPDAFEKIDRLKDKGQDLETALVTKNINDFDGVDALGRYFKILLYSSSTLGSLYCVIQAFSFLRKEEVNELIKSYGFSRIIDYKIWFENCLNEVAALYPLVSSRYLQRAINGFFEGANRPNSYFLSVNELRSLALAILRKYVGKIDDESWRPETAFALSEINDSADHMSSEAAYVMYESMHERFEKYTKGLVVVFMVENDKRVSLVSSFHLRIIFTIDDFEHLVFDKEYDNAPEIEIVRGFWRIYQANYYTAFSLPKGRNEKDREEAFRYELDLLEGLERCEKRIKALHQEWLQKRRLATLDKYLDGVVVLKNEVNANPLEIRLKEDNNKEIEDFLREINSYRQHAADIDDNVVSGDFVRIRSEFLTKNNDIQGLGANVLCYLGKNDKGLCQIRGVERLIPASELEAIPIDGVADKSIYFDPVIAASTGSHPIELSSNKSYYMEQFEHYSMEGKTYKEWVVQQGFQFVHEVQHWLREEFDENLAIN